MLQKKMHQFGKTVHPQTLQNILHEDEYFILEQIQGKKNPFISEADQKKRPAFAQE